MDINLLSYLLNLDTKRTYAIAEVLEGTQIIKKVGEGKIGWVGLKKPVPGAEGSVVDLAEELFDGEDEQLKKRFLKAKRKQAQLREADAILNEAAVEIKQKRESFEESPLFEKYGYICPKEFG